MPVGLLIGVTALTAIGQVDAVVNAVILISMACTVIVSVSYLASRQRNLESRKRLQDSQVPTYQGKPDNVEETDDGESCSPPHSSSVQDHLAGRSEEGYRGEYHNHQMEQYKLYVEMTDRVS